MRIRRSLHYTLAALALVSIDALAQTPSDFLTLDKAIELALASNRPAQVAALDEARAADDAAALRTRRLPFFDLKVLAGGALSPLTFSFGQGVFGTFPATGPIPFEDVTVESPSAFGSAILFSAVQPLTQLRKVSLGGKLLDLGREIAAAKTRARRQATVVDVKRAYYGLLQTRSGLAVMQQAATQLEELDRTVAGYVQSELALPADLLAVRTERARIDRDTTALRNLHATLTERLNLLIGRDLGTPFAVVDPPPPAPLGDDIGVAVARAKAHHPAIREASLTVQRAEGDLRLSALDRAPDVSLAFGFLRLDNVEVLPPTVAAAGIVVNWEPFDWGRRRHESAARSRTLEQARLGLREAEAMVELDVRVKFRKIAEAKAAVRVAKLARETAAERVRVAKDRYAAETALLKDLLEAQTSMARASQEYDQALTALWTARAELDEAMGGQ